MCLEHAVTKVLENAGLKLAFLAVGGQERIYRPGRRGESSDNRAKRHKIAEKVAVQRFMEALYLYSKSPEAWETIAAAAAAAAAADETEETEV